MQERILIKNVRIVNENRIYSGSVSLRGEYIEDISEQIFPDETGFDKVIDGKSRYLLPGVIDDQVHFREPGLTHKADILSESRAAVAGGVTSYMEMPNTKPQTITQDLLEAKYQLGSEHSMANYSFYFGATNDNLGEVLKTDPKNVCGIKIFMGASTGNMLVDNKKTLSDIFKESPMLIATHCEDEETIRANTQWARQKYGENPPIHIHPVIRSEEACYKSSSMAAELAARYNTRLHILHLSTARELSLFDNSIPLSQKKITAEACIHHLWFNSSDYDEKLAHIKWNPAVKSKADQQALLEGVKNDKIDVIATDHAPHTLDEKNNSYFKAPSGGPMVQHSLVAMMEMYRRGKISIEKIVEKMSHAPADMFKINKRGYIREGYKADLVIVDPNTHWQVSKENILYKAGWSPLEGEAFHSRVDATIINGHVVYENGSFDNSYRGERLTFNR